MRFLFVMAFLCASHFVHATNYYFSTVSGDDSRTSVQAQNPATPWKTLSKLNSFFSSLVAGDSILFKRGETFYGGIVASKSGTSANPIRFGAYGSGAKPIISGFTTINTWTSLGSNIWESTVAASTLTSTNMVVINGENCAMGRYPNTGYLTYEGHTANTSITDNQLTASPNWTGAEVVVRMTHWVINRSPITSHVGTKINYTSSEANYDPINGFGYFIQNDARTLDAQNEWYFDPSSKKIKIYSTSNPGTVKVASVEDLVTATSKAYLTFDNISFEGASSDAFNISFSNNVIIQNCDITYSGDDAIYCYPNSPSLIVQNCFINHSNNAGINAAATENAVIRNNTVNNTGIFSGMGKEVGGNYEAIVSNGNNGEISYNVIRNTGYCGIKFDGNATVVKNNFIDYFCFIKDDGAGIYGYPSQGQTSYTQRTIKDNIVINAIGAVGGTNAPSYLPAEGIYLDASASFADITNNTIANCINIGLFLNNSKNVNSSGNTVYNCASLLRMTKFQNIAVENNTFNNNRLIARTATQRVLYLSNDYDAAENYFTGNNNYYARPIDDNITIIAFADGNGSGYYNLAGWKTFSGQDANSKKSPKVISTVNDLRFEYNETSVSKTISLGANYIDVANVSYPGTITLAPYSSAVLIKNGTGNVLPAANAGADQTITLPISSVNLTGSGNDPDGTISSYAWTKITGPATGSITSPTAAITTFTALVQGVYTLELKVTDNSGGVGRDTVKITVNAAGNQSPVANAGTDKTIVLPASSVTLTGTGTDSDGTISSYAWTKVSGPAGGTITSASSATTTVTGLIQGVYIFELRVTDNNAATATDQVQVTVNAVPVNQAPTANAGGDQSITLPTSSVSLTGTGTDPDGTISSYAWTKVSGPSGGTITSASSATTTVTGLIQGVYVFELRVTDNNGASATDQVQVTVNAAPANQAPTANAGLDQNITLPTNTATLTGSGSDVDGTIASYAWTKVSGPSGGTITSASSATTTVTGLIQGAYIFQLRVTDNNGATATDQVQVNVNAATPNTAYGGIPWPIPGTIQMEDFDTGGQNVSYFDGSTGNQGGAYRPTESVDLQNTTEGVAYIGWTEPGEWMKYSVNVLSTGIYTLQARVASLNAVSSFRVEIDGVTIATITCPNTGGYQVWQSVTVNNISLSAGYRELRIYCISGGFNINYVTFSTLSNLLPVSNAGTDQTIVLPANSVTLTGTGTDPDGTISSYAWTKVSGPAGGTITSASSATTTVTGLIQGAYIFQLRVTDNNGATATDQVQVTVNAAPANQAPTANAGLDQNITLPTNTATLTGGGSDVDGTISSYAWTKVSGPAGGTITSASSATTTVTGLIQGVYIFELRVTDNNGATATDQVQVTVNAAPANQAPTANAGLDQNITLPTSTATLTGIGSDVDGTIASYAWTKVSGPSGGTITSASSATTTVTGLIQGAYIFQLRVTDNNSATATDQVQVNVNAATPNTAYGGIPWPIPGTIQMEDFDTGGQNVSYFDGSTGNQGGAYRPTESVDLQNTTEGVAYIGWTEPGEWMKYSVNVLSTGIYTLQARVASLNAVSSFRVEIDGVTIATITSPNTGGYQVWQSVTVNNISLSAGYRELRIYCITGGFNINFVTFSTLSNLLPVSNAGTDQAIVLPANSVTLTGTGTDPDGTISSYAWTKVSGPAGGTITSASSATTTVTGLIQGVYIFQLRVTDNNGATATDQVQVTVNAANQAPTANAGIDQSITLPANSVTLTGTGTDPDGTISSYVWTKVSGPAGGTITSASSATTTVTGLIQGVYIFQLRVTDNNGATATDQVQVTVNAANQAPTANAGIDQSITLPANSVTLTGTGTDPDGTISSYAWTKVSGPAGGTITSASSATTTVTGLTQGVYIFQLRVTDNNSATATDQVQVTVNAASNQLPVANAGTDQSVTLPVNSVTLNGSGTDADGTIASYAWTKLTGPATFSISSVNSATTTINSLVQGVYTFELRVTDNSGASATDVVQVTVSGITNTPYSGTPLPIPGTIEIEDYDNGGQNLAYYDATTGNSGGFYRPSEAVDLQTATEGTAFMGWTNDNEWTKYTVNVTSAGTYTLVARVSTFSSVASCRVEMDGITIATIAVPTTGGYQSWQNVSIPNIPLTAGIKTLRFYIVVGGFNITRLIFNQTGTSRGITDITGTTGNRDSDPSFTVNPVSIYPNPVVSAARVQINNPMEGTVQISLLDLNGKRIWERNAFKNAGSFTEIIEMRYMASGIYVMEVILPRHERKTYKIVKQ